MDLKDLISGGSEYIKDNRPESPDMDRISEIVLEMKQQTEEAADLEEHSANWRKLIDSIIDYDALAWQAINVAFDVFGIKNGMDLLMLRSNPKRHEQFVGVIQAFYDGFLLGAQFERRGGHR